MDCLFVTLTLPVDLKLNVRLLTTLPKVLQNSRMLSTMQKVSSSAKSLKASQTFQEADDILPQWFYNMRLQNKVINDNLLIASFKRILERNGHELASDGAFSSWIQRWRGRHKVKFAGVHGGLFGL